MERHPILSQAPAEAAHIPLYPKPFRKSRHFGAFLICCALFVAGFALTALWRNTDGNLWGKKDPNQTPPENTVEEDPHLEEEESPEEKPIPEGATRIVSRDLSYIEKGMEYLNNQTAYHPNIPELLQRDIQGKHTQEPLVLVLHTHTSEGYLSENCTYFDGDVGEQTYTQEEARNMLAIGKAFVAALNKNGITAIHCTVMHDAAGLAGSYERAAQSIQFFREQYPSIQYVVDLHRDAILTADGEYVRPITEERGESVAQILPVVGSDANGWEHENWEGNLALALQLRRQLNQNGASLCRPVMLKKSTYNQEMAPYAILLEIGTGANSISEAIAAATLAGEAFAKVILSY